MKLKKIASLAMAGVLAVSMLAGCGDNASSSSENTKPTTTPAIVAAIDNAQADNDAQVAFTYDSALESTLKQACSILGNNAIANASKVAKDVSDKVKLLTGENGYVAATALYNDLIRPETYDYNHPTGPMDTMYVKEGLDGTDQTVLSVYTVTSTDAPNQEAALKVLAQNINKELKKLDDRTANVPSGYKYYDYTYTGTVAMTTVTLDNGTSVYVVIHTLTQAVAEK